MTDLPCQTPSVLPTTARTLSGGGVLDRAGRKLPRLSRPRGHQAVVRRESGRALAIRHSGDVLLSGASGASSLLLNTKASQEAACSRAPAAIVPGQQPESHDAGVSRFAENGSHLEAADTAESYARQVDGPGSSRNAEIGSHLEATGAAEGLAWQADGPGGSGNAENGSHLEATGAAEDHAGQVDGPGSNGNARIGSHLEATDAAESLAGGVPPGVNENGQVGCWDVGEGKARAALSARKCHQRCTQYVRCNSISTDKTVFLSLLAGETRLCPDKSPMLRRANAHQLPPGRGHCLTKARCYLCRQDDTLLSARPVADKCLIMSEIMICPVWFC